MWSRWVWGSRLPDGLERGRRVGEGEGVQEQEQVDVGEVEGVRVEVQV